MKSPPQRLRTKCDYEIDHKIEERTDSVDRPLAFIQRVVIGDTHKFKMDANGSMMSRFRANPVQYFRRLGMKVEQRFDSKSKPENEYAALNDSHFLVKS